MQSIATARANQKPWLNILRISSAFAHEFSETEQINYATNAVGLDLAGALGIYLLPRGSGVVVECVLAPSEPVPAVIHPAVICPHLPILKLSLSFKIKSAFSWFFSWHSISVRG
jgi:hypothetical protein